MRNRHVKRPNLKSSAKKKSSVSVNTKNRVSLQALQQSPESLKSKSEPGVPSDKSNVLRG